MPALQVDLQPYELDEFVVWAFRRGLRGRIDDSDVDALVRSLESWRARRAFVKGLLSGAAVGAHARLEEEIQGTLALVQAGMNWSLEGYTTVFDPVLMIRGLLALAETPGTKEFDEAVARFGAEMRIRHPALNGALEALAEAVPVLRALADWLQEPDAMRQILGGLASEFGDLLGTFWADVAALTGKPGEQGDALGKAIGRVSMEIALFVLDLV